MTTHAKGAISFLIAPFVFVSGRSVYFIRIIFRLRLRSAVARR